MKKPHNRDTSVIKNMHIFYEQVVVSDRFEVKSVVYNFVFFTNCFDMKVTVQSSIRFETMSINDFAE